MTHRLSSLARLGLAVSLLACVALAAAPPTLAAPLGAPARTVAIVTPYLTAPATHEMVGLLQNDARPYGWKTIVVSSESDIPTIASKMEDVITRKVSAIVVVSTDLHLLKKQIADAQAAKIPVFGLDAEAVPGVVASVSSNSDQMSSLATAYLLKRMGYKGNLVVLTYSPHPGVHERTLQMYRMIKKYPAVHVVTQQEIDVTQMVPSGNKITANLLTAHPKAGDITGVWCGWDQPAIGATQAIMAAHREGIVVTGIDGSEQGVSLIKKGTPLVATVKQQFDKQAALITKEVARAFAGKAASARQLYAPASLITRDTLMKGM